MLGVQRELPTTGHVSHPFAVSARLHPISQDLHFLPHPLALSLTQTAERFEPTNMREWRNYALAALLLLHDERPLRRGWRVEVMEKVGVCLSGEFGRHGMRARNVSSTLVPRGWSGAGCKGKSYLATMLDNVQEVEGEGSRAEGESTQPHS